MQLENCENLLRIFLSSEQNPKRSIYFSVRFHSFRSVYVCVCVFAEVFHRHRHPYVCFSFALRGFLSYSSYTLHFIQHSWYQSSKSFSKQPKWARERDAQHIYLLSWLDFFFYIKKNYTKALSQWCKELQIAWSSKSDFLLGLHLSWLKYAHVHINIYVCDENMHNIRFAHFFYMQTAFVFLRVNWRCILVKSNLHWSSIVSHISKIDVKKNEKIEIDRTIYLVY